MKWTRARRTLLAAIVIASAGCAPEPPDVGGGASVKLGVYFVAQRRCASCHEDGHGTLAGSARPLPHTMIYSSNLTPDPATGLGDWADVQIVRALRTGIDNDLQVLCPSMPHYEDMGDLEADSIVAYLRSLKTVARPDIPESRCPPIKPLDPSLWPGTD